MPAEHNDAEMDLLAILQGGENADGEEREKISGRQELTGDDGLQQQQEQHHHHHLSSIQKPVVIRQLRSEGLSFQLWPAASSLVSLLDQNPSPFLAALPNRRQPPLRVLELGSGTGLVGIAAAAVLGAHVTITDLPHVLPNLFFNSHSNASAIAANGGKVEVRQLRWGNDDDLASEQNAFDLILASDVAYYDHLFDPLLQTLQFFLRGEVVFLMAHMRRWKKRDSVFFRKARKLFDVAVLHRGPPLPGSRIGVVVYRFVEKGRCNDGSSTILTLS